jgi:membrane-associated phospholipid phosphatase
MTHYRLVDYATQGYLLFVAAVVLAFHNARLPVWPWLVGTHAVLVPLVHALIRRAARPQPPAFVLLLRDCYPLLLYGLFYWETELVNRMFGTPRIDALLMRADHAVFGGQPAEAFMPTMPGFLFSELMHLSYFSFYVMIGGLGVWLGLRDRKAAVHFVTVVSLVFYLCYATYLFLPAVGPRVMFHDSPERSLFFELYGRAPQPVPESAVGGPAFAVMDVIERHAEIRGAAFPSSHVALAWITAWFSWRYVRPIRWLHVGFAGLICLSTVYGRFHYGVDVLAGILVAAVLFPIANGLHRRFAERTDAPSQSDRS